MNRLNTSYVRRSVPLRGCLSWLAPTLVVAGLSLAALPVQAAQTVTPDRHDAKAGKEKVAALAAKDPETTSSIQPNTEPNCARSRQRLFVEGEGWIVRRVTTCY